MDRLPVELLYLLAIAGFLLFNHVMQKLARRRQEEEAAQQPPVQQEEAPQVEHQWPGDDTWGRTPVAPPVVIVPEPPAAAPRPARLAPAPEVQRRVHPVRAMLSDRRALRSAVVMTLVLGPCRAQQPPER